MMEIDLSKYQMVKVSKLHPTKNNYKQTKGPKVEAAKKKIKAALNKRGQIVNLIVRNHPLIEGEYEVVNGNHRLEVLIEENQDEAICCLLGEISDADASMIAFETNELDVEEDWEKVAALVKNISKTKNIAKILETSPWDKTLIDSLLGNPIVVDLNKEWKGMPEYEQEGKKPFKTITLHFVDQAAVTQFTKLTGQNMTDKTKFAWYPKAMNIKISDKRYTSNES